jgi:hypothetical protein
MSVKKKSAKSDSVSASGNQAVGYKSPPKATRFKRGKSGNPAGRPLGSPNKLPEFGADQVKSILRTELYRDIEVVKGKTKFTAPAITVIAQKLIEKANAGDFRAAQMLFEFGLRFESEERKEYEKFARYCQVYLQLWHEFLEHARRCQIEVAEPIPHPRQFVMDLNSGLITIKGPMTKGEAESGMFDDDMPIFTQSIARRFMATMELPPGKDIRHYIQE